MPFMISDTQNSSGHFVYHVAPANQLPAIMGYGLFRSHDDDTAPGVLLYDDLDAVAAAAAGSFGNTFDDDEKLALLAVPIELVRNRVDAEYGKFYCDFIVGFRTSVVSTDFRSLGIDEIKQRISRPTEEKSSEATAYPARELSVPVEALLNHVVDPSGPLTYEQWIERYAPIFDAHNVAPVQSQRFHGHSALLMGEGRQEGLEIDPHHLWTLLDVDGKLFVANGLHYVNRVDHFVCRHKWAEGAQIEFEYDEELNDRELPFDLDLSGDGENTRISYQYRDADNWKTAVEEVVSGQITRDQVHEMADKLTDYCIFDPALVGLCRGCPDENGPDWNDDVDHVFHELLSIERTSDNITAGSVDDLVEAWALVNEEWTDIHEPQPHRVDSLNGPSM